MISALGQQDHRPARVGEQPQLGGVRCSTTSAAVAGSATMIANGLSPRSLRLRSVLTAVASAGVAGQVIATDSLDGQDRARGQQRARLD